MQEPSIYGFLECISGSLDSTQLKLKVRLRHKFVSVPGMSADVGREKTQDMKAVKKVGMGFDDTSCK